MADSKLSALPLASTPLGGTEQVYVVQGGVDKRVPTSAIGGGASIHPGYSASRLYAAGPQSITTAAPGTGAIYYHPFILAAPATLVSIAIYVGGAQTSGAVCYIGLYNNSNGVPTTAILRSGSMATTSFGMKTYTPASPISLPAGIYWGATLFSNSGGTVQSYQTTGGFGGWTVGNSTGGDWLTGCSYGLADSTFSYASGLPTTSSAASSMQVLGSSTIPAVHFRVS